MRIEPVSWMKTKGEAGGVRLIALLLFAYAMALPAAENADHPPSEPKSSQAERTDLPEMTVTAAPGRDTGYSVPKATTATKTDTPIMETPVSIQVVPRQLIQDRQAITLERAMETVSGVRADSTYGGAKDDFIIRGLSNGFRTYRNGLLNVYFNFDTAIVDRIEVLKGPSAVLYGRSQPGGLVNLVTKQPLDHSYYSLEQQFGSLNHYRTTVDATGP